MVHIPADLLEQTEHGNLLLFLGAGIACDDAGHTLPEALTAALATRAGLADEAYTFPEVAQIVADTHGRATLVEWVAAHLAALEAVPQPLHHLIARLTSCTVLLTTIPDPRLERAFAEAERPLVVITGSEAATMPDAGVARFYRPWGSLEQPASLVLTEADQEAFFEHPDGIPTLLRGELAQKTILIAGYDLADPVFRQLYRKLTAALDNYRQCAYALVETPAPKLQHWCRRHGIDLIAATPRDFLETLTDALADRAQAGRATPPPPADELDAPLPTRPYKQLDYYEAADAAIFYGRRQETQTLSALVHAHRLVLLYGASGVGKTSLLLAGVGPRLERSTPAYRSIYVRALEDPTQVIRRALRRLLPEVALPDDAGEPTLVPGETLADPPDERERLIALRELLRSRFSESDLRDLCFDMGIAYAELPEGGTSDKARELVSVCYRRDRIDDLIAAGRRLHPEAFAEAFAPELRRPTHAARPHTLVDLLDSATRALGCPLVIFLDQFEEFFIRLSPQVRADFIAELGTLYDTRGLPVKLVLSLREDWLAAVSEIEARIPDIFRTRLRLLPLTRDQAQAAMTAPVARLGVQYDPALVERLLDDLVGSAGSAVLSPQLQLVCSTLYAGLTPTERQITLAHYERLGGARGVLRQYLEDELARLPRDERTLARAALEELVTSQGTKTVKSGADLARGLEVEPSRLLPVLEKLVRARLLRALDRDDDGPAYELAHEYLIREIGLSEAAQQRKL
jgi:energy-coupling factor transporter ATP-binding protein EcfA2